MVNNRQISKQTHRWTAFTTQNQITQISAADKQKQTSEKRKDPKQYKLQSGFTVSVTSDQTQGELKFKMRF